MTSCSAAHHRVAGFFCMALVALASQTPTPAFAPETDIMERFRQMSARAESAGLADSFKGVTANGEVVPGIQFEPY